MDTPKLEEIYKLQKELMDPYVKIEGLPQYPIDINQKANQKLLKEFIGRVVEELAEAFECYDSLLMGRQVNKTRDELLPLVKDFNMEISDALHFFVELLIFSNIEPVDIQNYFDILLSDNDLSGSAYDSDNILTTSLFYGNYLNIQMGTPKFSYGGYQIYVQEQGPYNENMRGGNQISSDRLDELKSQFWDITYTLNLAGNSLKKKPWKQTEVETDEQGFQNLLMEAYIRLFRMLSFIGMSELSILTVYKTKNTINQERIKNKY